MHYFAYGSNMNFDHMRRLCGWHFTVLGVAVLNDYEFGPDGRGYANILPKNGKKVFGVLYDLDQKALDILDDFEGYPDVFNRVHVTVQSNGHDFRAWVYIEDGSLFGGTHMRQDYLKRVLAGATENRLPDEWINFLSSFATSN